MTKLTQSLKADLPALAELLRSKGKNNDSILAHINPREAALLKRHGGSGDINPDTGLPQFDDTVDFGDAYQPAEGYVARPETVNPEQYNLTMRQQDYAQSPANPYTDANLFPGNAPPAEGQATMYSPTGAASYGTPQTLQAGYSQDVADLAAGQYAGAVPQGQAITGGTVGQGTVFSPTGGQYTQADLDRIAVNQSPTGAPQAPQSTLGQIGSSLGNVSSATLMKALGLGGLGLLGARNARQGGADIQQATSEKTAIAQPYQAQGQAMIGAAQRGELTPQSQQAYQAAMAQSNQAMAGRGGVGQAQQQQAMAALYNQLLQNQYTYGLQVAQIGDNIQIGAITSGLQLDRSLQQTTQNFYTQLAAVASGTAIGGTRQGVA